jgi:hypothetical protein
MTLAPGIRLGPYEILAPLGTGGWVRFTAPMTTAWGGSWRSRSFARNWPESPWRPPPALRYPASSNPVTR